MQYDEEEYLTGGLITSREDWARLLGEPLPLPPAYQQPRAIHLVTEFPEEPMVRRGPRPTPAGNHRLAGTAHRHLFRVSIGTGC